MLLIGRLGTSFGEILIDILTFSFKKMRLKVSSAKWRPFNLGFNVLSLYWHGKHIKPPVMYEGNWRHRAHYGITVMKSNFCDFSKLNDQLLLTIYTPGQEFISWKRNGARLLLLKYLKHHILLGFTSVSRNNGQLLKFPMTTQIRSAKCGNVKVRHFF